MNDLLSFFDGNIPSIVQNIFNYNLLDYLMPSYYDSKEDFLFPICRNLSFIKDDNEYFITSFISKKTIEEDLLMFDTMVDYKKQFFPISFEVYPISAWLLLGVSEKNYGQIWMTDEGGDKLKMISDNVYDFLFSCKRNTQNIRGLYKNWEEDFWRIKD